LFPAGRQWYNDAVAPDAFSLSNPSSRKKEREILL
jgi:hypothetical protein